MIQFNPMTLAFTVFLIALLNGCNASSYEPVKSEPIGTVVEQKKIHIDWSKIDTKSDISVDNTPRDVDYPDHIVSLANAVNRPVADIYRHEMVYGSAEVQQFVDQVKAQLGHSYVDIYGNGDGLPKYFIVTRQNVVADNYEYVIKKGELRGFSIAIEILPIADKSRAQMLDVYNSQEDIEKIDKIIKKYGGEMQGIGFTPMGFKIVIDTYFQKSLTPIRHKQVENELKQLTGVNVEVRQTGRLMF